MIIGYTGGTFDLFHVGHMNLLIRVKSLCDYLIVGVSTDKLVKKYKKRSPIISLEERKGIIRAIKGVHKVIDQTTLDKVKMQKKTKADIVFIGSDWCGTDSWNEYEKKINVVYLPYTKGISTTIIKERIKNEITND